MPKKKSKNSLREGFFRVKVEEPHFLRVDNGLIYSRDTNEIHEGPKNNSR